jgi:hypothetical protein
MSSDRTHIPTPREFQELLGYLNFSSGSSDPQFLQNLGALFAAVESDPGAAQNSWQAVGRSLREQLEKLAGSEPAFQDVEQARGVLRLAFEVLPARYRDFHRDLLFHQRDAELFRPFFIARACEAVLEQGGPWNDVERIVGGAITRLNDYIGYRPVAVLRTAQRIEPYRHEWCRPIPLYVRSAGVGPGPYREVVEHALEILRTTDESILREAYFDPELLDELALDPRAYDFDHPVNKRPNYHFGQWDPHHIDNQGRYRRFVVQQVTLDVLSQRVVEHGDLPREEVLVEAAAVLAGTILMASGTSGNGPEAHDSSTTLSTLLPRIAAYRDAFYEQFIERLGGRHASRLRAEAEAGKQPLAAARQHLNQQLARRRAAQLEHVHLALLFARMGYSEAALQQAQVVPVAAARMACEIQCRLTAGHLAIDADDLQPASKLLAEIEDYLHRAIECGALVDPWNILGFQGEFSLFPSPENSVPDHRLEQLIELVDEVLGLYARLWSEAASRSDDSLQAALSDGMGKLARWWDQFAPTSVESIEAFFGADAYDSAREVADALKAFHQAGAAAGDIAFWRTRVAQFNSPKAYALVVGALCQKPDLVAAMALLMQWLSQAGVIPLRQGDYSFHALVDRWLADVCAGVQGDTDFSAPERNALVARFFELLEANAEDYWRAPSLDLLGTAQPDALDEADELEDDELDDDESDEEEDDEDDEDEEDEEEPFLYGAAYDEMVYIDSTGDGVEADMLESGPAPATDFELEQEARRVGERLELLRTVASLWKRAVLALGPNSEAPLPQETLRRWLDQVRDNERNLLSLLRTVNRRRVPAPSTSRDSLLEFELRRAVKESLLERIVATVIETADAARAMRAAMPTAPQTAGPDELIDDVSRAVVRQDRCEVERLWPQLLEFLQQRPLLYLPVSKGGDPVRLVRARALVQLLRDLLGWLPKLGLIRQTCQLLETARLMESSNPVGPGAISEYDRLFAAGYESLVEAIVTMSEHWPAAGQPERADHDLVECLEKLTEPLLNQWLAHGRTLRLSVLERIADEKSWQDVKRFIEQYGGDLFTQRFLNMSNLRAILHQGVDTWLDRLVEDDRRDEYDFRLLDDFAESLSPGVAIEHLSLVIEAIVENYAAYRDYNSTTTQSDRGEMLYTLLDFLRLRVQYDRVAWHMKPVLIAHGVLVRRGRSAAAEIWRRALAERTAELADKLQIRAGELRKQYAMQLPTVTDRLAERFVRPLVIDRMRALVGPAMDDVRRGAAPSSGSPFELLEQETAELTQEPTGVGLEVPAWLAALEQEVASQSRAAAHLNRDETAGPPLDQAQLTAEEVQQQLTGWERNPL